jgi:hypothetical protein
MFDLTREKSVIETIRKSLETAKLRREAKLTRQQTSELEEGSWKAETVPQPTAAEGWWKDRLIEWSPDIQCTLLDSAPSVADLPDCRSLGPNVKPSPTEPVQGPAVGGRKNFSVYFALLQKTLRASRQLS